MVMQSEAPQQASPNALKAQQPMTNGRADGGALAIGASEPDIAWEMVKEECHDVLEQLPLTLQRNFTLMRDLDVQVAAHLQAIPSVLQEYLQLRVKMAQDVVMADDDAKPRDDLTAAADPEAPDAAPRERPFSRASFSSASLTPITDSPSTRSTSLPNSRNVQDDSTNILDDEEETEEPETSFESQIPIAEPPSSTQLIGRVATLATDAVRGSLEKVNLANAAYAVIDRHVRALDLAIAEQEQAIAAGIRPGTRPAAIVIPKGSSPSHGHSHSYESNGLLALAEVASAVAEKTLESMQPLPSAGSTVLTWNDKEAPIEEKPTATGKKEASKPKAQQPKRDRKKRNAAAKEEVADPNEPTYCYCDRVSFGNMIACDGPNCKREWFHWECVGITRNPTASKWYCRDCEGKVEPARKKRKR